MAHDWRTRSARISSGASSSTSLPPSSKQLSTGRIKRLSCPWNRRHFKLIDTFRAAGNPIWCVLLARRMVMARGDFGPTLPGATTRIGQSTRAARTLHHALRVGCMRQTDQAIQRGRAKHAPIKTWCEPHRHRLAGMHQDAFPATIQHIHPPQVCRIQVNPDRRHLHRAPSSPHGRGLSDSACRSAMLARRTAHVANRVSKRSGATAG